MKKFRRGKIKRHVPKPKPDLNIVLDETGQVESLTKTYTDTVMYGKTNPGDRTIGLIPNDEPRHGDIAQTLLNVGRWKAHAGKIYTDDPSMVAGLPDDRPLIDLLHEATFTNPIGMSFVAKPYDLRMLLRKAHCFTLNDATSSMVADFSMATIADLDAARHMAIPPFPVTWIELNNHARLKRMKELQFSLDPDDPANPPAKRIGWLIHPSPDGSDGFYATYVTHIDMGIWVAPMSYWWHSGRPNPDRPSSMSNAGKLMEWLMFGTAGNVGVYDAFPHPSNLHLHYKETPGTQLVDAMREMAGELRHIWGFLIALGYGQLGKQVQLTPQPLPTRSPPIMKNGKPLLPLEHKILHLHLHKKLPATLIAQAITHHHNRRHDVRAHWRLLKSGKRVPVKSHQRGDETLGRIEKTYRVER